MNDLLQYLKELMPKAMDWIIKHQGDKNPTFATIHPIVLFEINRDNKKLTVLPYNHNEVTIGWMLREIVSGQTGAWGYKKLYIGTFWSSYSTTEEIN